MESPTHCAAVATWVGLKENPITAAIKATIVILDWSFL